MGGGAEMGKGGENQHKLCQKAETGLIKKRAICVREW